jgi:hypothetical protein
VTMNTTDIAIVSSSQFEAGAPEVSANLLGGPIRLIGQTCDLMPGDLVQLNVVGLPRLARVAELQSAQER